MSLRLPVLAGMLAAGLCVGGCGDDSPATPTTPTTVPTPTPPPPPPPPPAVAELESVTLNPDRVESQGNPEGTVRLTAPAPSAGAVVTLSSGNPDVVQVPANVTVAAGSSSNTFRIGTSTVSTNSVVTVIATYAGVTKSAQLTVLPPALAANFTVTSASRGTDACDIVTSAGAIDCVFNARESRGFVARYLWTMKIGNTELSFSAPDEQAEVTPNTTCGFLANGTSADGKVSMEVSLQLEDRSGNRSGTARRTVAVHHNNRCGY
jgi:hypothetical protein